MTYWEWCCYVFTIDGQKHSAQEWKRQFQLQDPQRGVEVPLEQFWRLLKSVFRIKSIQLGGDGLYAGLLIKVIAFLLVLRLQAQKTFKNLSVMQTLRKIRREGSLDTLIDEHFHALISRI